MGEIESNERKVLKVRLLKFFHFSYKASSFFRKNPLTHRKKCIVLVNSLTIHDHDMDYIISFGQHSGKSVFILLPEVKIKDA